MEVSVGTLFLHFQKLGLGPTLRLPNPVSIANLNLWLELYVEKNLIHSLKKKKKRKQNTLLRSPNPFLAFLLLLFLSAEDFKHAHSINILKLEKKVDCDQNFIYQVRLKEEKETVMSLEKEGEEKNKKATYSKGEFILPKICMTMHPNVIQK